ncbi:glycoside hydrolase family 9 protein [Ohtaekwangia sp.]|uniref:glycoside hydrolase family 9 protein n=1 Tax=Ohtaekwangia sp. TaxID=2066019 RepID=UPI002FDCF68E
MQKEVFVFVLIVITACNVQSQRKEKLSPDDIRLNQIGYYPTAPKSAVIIGETPTTFLITTPDGRKVFEGQLSEIRKSKFSDKKTRIADFSAFTTPGNYTLVVPGVGTSYPFEIRAHVHDAVAKGAAKGFYYQRLSTDLPEKYAGKWHRAAGEPDDKVLIHPSAASANRPEGTVISSPRGWLDAGDYNKYIVNSGITMGTLLSLYEDFPEYVKTISLNIPESNNTVPDLLDEALWNLRWMLTMQDPGDGGVYHKLTNTTFDRMIMPDKATRTRYVVQKGTAATLDFAAVTAQAARIFRAYDKELPGLADSCLTAAAQAWQWAKKNPSIVYDQDAMNRAFEPDVTTGGYGDRDLTDEFVWAAAELYATTQDAQYIAAVTLLPRNATPLPAWAQVRLLGYYTLIRNELTLPEAHDKIETLKQSIVHFADSLISGVDTRAFNVVMGGSARDYIWGSSSVAANQGIVLIQAYRITRDKKYLNYALSNLDFLMGKNGTGYSFLTGFGDKSTMHPHHRPSIADGIAEPVPGLLAGGPNPGMQDKCKYSSSVPDEAYSDTDCSYASNEIAINWNAPFVYLVWAIEATE